MFEGQPRIEILACDRGRKNALSKGVEGKNPAPWLAV